MKRSILFLLLIFCIITVLLPTLVYCDDEAVIEVEPSRIYALKPVKIRIKVYCGETPVKNALVVIEGETGGMLMNGTKERVEIYTNEFGVAEVTLTVSRCGLLKIQVSGGEPSVECETEVFVFFETPPPEIAWALLLDTLLIFVPLAFFLYIGPIRARRMTQQ